tara:strand:+ start:1390 stop:1575 length:186 start_codon:yes stop_codon:yes gene_type:complete
MIIKEIINSESHEFYWWLKWLVEVKDYNANEIIDASWYPHRFQGLQKEYLKAKEKGEINAS